MLIDTAFLRNDELALVLEKTVDGSEEKDWVPAYHFAICNPSGVKMGSCQLRIGHSETLYYSGNIGYCIEPPYRGHHYAGKACRLLLELARRHRLGYLIITCNPDNYASQKTCEFLGAELLETSVLPQGNPMRSKGETEKCIYRVTL